MYVFLAHVNDRLPLPVLETGGTQAQLTWKSLSRKSDGVQHLEGVSKDLMMQLQEEE